MALATFLRQIVRGWAGKSFPVFNTDYHLPLNQDFAPSLWVVCPVNWHSHRWKAQKWGIFAARISAIKDALLALFTGGESSPGHKSQFS
jgi:hypothetical protein